MTGARAEAPTRPREAAAPERPRLLLVSTLPPPTGGIPTWTLALLGSSLAERFEMRVVDSSPSRKDEVKGGSRFRLDRARDALALLARLAGMLTRFRPQVVHVNTPYYWAFLRDGLAVWLARAFGARTLLHFRGGDFPEFAEGLRRPWRDLVRLTLRRADRVVALTSATHRYLESIVPPERVRYLPNFVRTDELAPGGGEGERSGAREPGPVRLLFVGWMIPAKGVRELLWAAARVPGIHLTLAGPSDPLFVESIRGELDALGDRVRLLPEQPREAILALYREAEVFVLPTYREGFPNALLEAMAAGLPAIATPVGAIPDALRDGEEGLLVPPRDGEALAEALRRLVAEPALRRRMGRRARERAEGTFSLPAVLGQIESVYGELLDEASGTARLRASPSPGAGRPPSSRPDPSPPDR